MIVRFNINRPEGLAEQFMYFIQSEEVLYQALLKTIRDHKGVCARFFTNAKVAIVRLLQITIEQPAGG